MTSLSRKAPKKYQVKQITGPVKPYPRVTVKKKERRNIAEERGGAEEERQKPSFTGSIVKG